MDADGGDIVQLTTSGIARWPQCSADSKQVYYSVAGSGFVGATLWAVPLAGGTPRQMLPPEASNTYEISSGRLAGCNVAVEMKNRWKVLDLASGRVVSDLALDESDNTGTTRLSPDSRAVVKPVLRGGSRTLLYQPLDGSAPHTLIDPVQETIRDFGWSPSGKQLAVLKLKSSSDVVLIKDEQGKGKD